MVFGSRIRTVRYYYFLGKKRMLVPFRSHKILSRFVSTYMKPLAECLVTAQGSDTTEAEKCGEAGNIKIPLCANPSPFRL